MSSVQITPRFLNHTELPHDLRIEVENQCDVLSAHATIAKGDRRRNQGPDATGNRSSQIHAKELLRLIFLLDTTTRCQIDVVAVVSPPILRSCIESRWVPEYAIDIEAPQAV